MFPLSLLRPHLLWTCVDTLHAASISTDFYVHQFCFVYKGLIFFKGFHSLWLLQSSLLQHFPQASWRVERIGLVEISHLGLSVLKAHFPVIDLWLCFPLLQVEAYLMITEQDTDLWIYHNVIRSFYISMFLEQSSSICFPIGLWLI